MNYGLVHAISSWLATYTTFKLNPVDLTYSENSGSSALIVFEALIIEEIGLQSVCRNTNIYAQPMEKFGANIYGVGIYVVSSS